MTGVEILEFWPQAVALSIVLAAIVTGLHILLRKQDVRAATGWLGLVWLAPLVGIILYWLLGVNRIRRRARELYTEHGQVTLSRQQSVTARDMLAALLPADSRHLMRLAQLGNRVTSQPLTCGNAVELLENGDAAYPRMLASIAAASRSVSLCTYIFGNDRWGQAFQRELHGAVNRGVEVRVLIDAVGARYSFPSILRNLAADGIPCARFMPSLWPWRFRYANLRNHRKILVCDGAEGYTGGMNIRAGNVLADGPPHPIADLHCFIQGPVVTELQDAFADDWRFASGESLIGEAWFPESLHAKGSVCCRGIADGPDEDFDKLHTTIMGALACAEREVTVLTPYFLPDERLSAALRVTALRGVRVCIVIPARSNLRLVQWASTPGLIELIEAGCEIWRTPPPFDHTKLILVDDCWVLIGSANIDPRSLVLNFEFNVECYGPEFAAAARRSIEARLARAERLHEGDLLELPLAIRLRDRLFRLLSPYL